jgi:peptidoglycan/xylan/chitin deacetylase (PgdA/CDA1 family)
VAGAALALQRRLFHPFIRVLYSHDVPAVSRDRFVAQLKMLRRSFEPATRDDLVALLRDGKWNHDKPGLILTFDDGLRSHMEVVAPVLDDLGFQGWFFVPIGLVQLDATEHAQAALLGSVLHGCDTTRDPRIFMTEQDLVQLARRHVIGCHTASHVRLSTALTDDDLDREIVGAKRRLEAVLQREVDSISWVGGEEWAYSPNAARRIAREFDYAFTTNTLLTRHGTPATQIDRTHFEADFSPALTRFQVSGLMDLFYAPKRRRLRIAGSVAPLSRASNSTHFAGRAP